METQTTNQIALREPMQLTAAIHTGDVESSNALCAEIARRFNEFPQDQKQ